MFSGFGPVFYMCAKALPRDLHICSSRNDNGLPKKELHRSLQAKSCPPGGAALDATWQRRREIQVPGCTSAACVGSVLYVLVKGERLDTHNTLFIYVYVDIDQCIYI